MEQVNKITKLEYLLLTLIIALTGFEVIFRASVVLQTAIMLFVACIFFNKKKKFDLRFWLFTAVILLPFFFQGVYINDLRLGFANIYAYIVKFMMCYMVVVLTKERFPLTYVNIIYFFAVISLFFFPIQFSEGLTASVKQFADSIIKPIGSENISESYVSSTLVVFTFQHAYGADVAEIRNCGPFWEPGMYAIFLNIALFINLFVLKTKLWSRKNIIFMIVIATTVSTTGIICVMIILFLRFFITLSSAKKVLYLPIFLIFIYIAYNFIWKLEVVSGKIEDNISISQDDRRSRFGAMIYHFAELQKSPLIGVSLDVGASEKDIAFEDRLVSPNGLSLVFFNFGIPIGIFYFVFFYKGAKRFFYYYNVNNTLIAASFFMIACILAFSQDITMRYFYLVILVFAIAYPKSKPLGLIK